MNFMMMAVVGLELRLLSLLVMYVIGRSTDASLIPKKSPKINTETEMMLWSKDKNVK